jgi:endonuclease YncB( thermonuclease family)
MILPLVRIGSATVRRRIWGVLTLLAIFFLPGVRSSCAAGMSLTETRLWGTVRAVKSAHEITVVSPDLGPLEVRLIGIVLPVAPQPGSKGDAADGQLFGSQAIDYLRDLILNKQVELTTYGKDRTGRLLSVVWLGEINVNVTMVKEGLAWMDPAVSVSSVRAALIVEERQAQVGKYGLWAFPNPEPPWEFRRRNHLAAE